MTSFNFYISLIVSLTIILIFLTFYLSMRDKNKLHIDMRRLNMLYFIILFFIIVFTLLILIENYRTPLITISNNEGYQLVIKNKTSTKNSDDVKKLNIKDYYSDPGNGFFFSLPPGDKWTMPRKTSGLISYMEEVGLETKRENIESFLEWNPYTELLKCFFSDLKIKPYSEIMQCVNNSLTWSVYGDMLKTSRSVQVKNLNKEDVTVRRLSEVHPGQFHPVDSVSMEINDTISSPANVPGSGDSVHYVPLKFVNYFSVSVFDKSLLGERGSTVALFNYFLNHTANMYSNIEKIFATENDIVVASSIHFPDAVVNGRKSNFKVHRWFRVVEESNTMYILEISYSPQTDADLSVWNNLKKMFESAEFINR